MKTLRLIFLILFQKLKDIMSSQDTKDTLILTIMCLKLENALIKQVCLIAMEFQEFFQLEPSLKVRPNIQI